MKKSILTKLIFIILIITFILLIMTIKSNAASLSIKASKSSVSPGEKFSVTVSVTGGAGYVNLSASNGTLSSTSIDLMLQSSVTVNCTAGNSGSVKISGSGVIADNITEQDDNMSASTTVTIISNSNSGGSGSSGGSANKPNNSNTDDDTPKSTDSSLKGLSVEEGAISPEFNKDVKEYTLTVPNEIGGANIKATPNDSKATISITGNVGLKEGENIVTITVRAEDGSSTNYVIKVMRLRPELSLKTLVLRYTNQEGQLITLQLNPLFNFETFEYSIEDLEYWVEKLEIDAIANIEEATIDIQGADNLVQGENTITITVKIPRENTNELEKGEEPQEEIKTYTIKLNKKEEPAPPTLMGKISNWFNGIFSGVTAWYNNNQEEAILGALGICVVALLGLSIYIIVDYKKYKILMEKLSKLNDIDKAEPLKENIIQNIAQKRIQEKDILEDIDNIEKNKNDRPKGGRHF